MRRVIALVSTSSRVLLAICFVVFLAGFVISPWKHYLTVTDSIHVGVWNRGFDSRIVIFNDSQYGPYRGSIIGIEGKDGNVYPKMLRQQTFGDKYGVYYRFFQWEHATLWTLMVSIWYPFGLFATTLIATYVCQKCFSRGWKLPMTLHR